MKNFNKSFFVTIFAITALLLGVSGPGVALAVTATAPNLGAASSFSALAGSAATSAAVTTVSGDVGVSPGSSLTGTWTHAGGANFLGGSAASAMASASSAWTTMGSSGGTAWDPSVDISPLPGLYTRSGNATFAGPTLTLNGSASDVWIFQINSTLTFTGTVNLTGGAQACNVFWRVASDATINSGGVGTQFVGTLIANGDVSLVGGPTINGRMVAVTGTLSTAGTTTFITPSCAAPSGGTRSGIINVVKRVINDNGGIKTIADFPLFVNGTRVFSGISNDFSAVVPDVYVVTETSDSNYTRTFSGDCDVNGRVGLNPGDTKYCIVTNDDIGSPVVTPPIPPLIDLVKVPSPLALPGGPGLVTYTYTLRNIGTVTVSDITLVGDSCSPIKITSGDINNNAKLETNETWVYKCSTTLSATHTNTVVATGWANGISATDIASATVVVGLPSVPPLIHVTKVPSPLTLSNGAGIVIYTERITNPGAVPLSNVRLSDDKCNPSNYISGDANNNLKLDTTETWIYSCQTNLTKTTTNTVTVSGDANGLTARDFAVATVVVSSAVPGLPKTGFPPKETNNFWQIIILSGVVAFSISMYVATKNKSKV